MAGLMVNVDHVATVRQARGIDEPDPVFAASIAASIGIPVPMKQVAPSSKRRAETQIKSSFFE